MIGFFTDSLNDGKFVKTIYCLYKYDNLIIEIEGSREFSKYCKENHIKIGKEWKLIKK